MLRQMGVLSELSRGLQSHQDMALTSIFLQCSQWLLLVLRAESKTLPFSNKALSLPRANLTSMFLYWHCFPRKQEATTKPTGYWSSCRSEGRGERKRRGVKVRVVGCQESYGFFPNTPRLWVKWTISRKATGSHNSEKAGEERSGQSINQCLVSCPTCPKFYLSIMSKKQLWKPEALRIQLGRQYSTHQCP